VLWSFNQLYSDKPKRSLLMLLFAGTRAAEVCSRSSLTNVHLAGSMCYKDSAGCLPDWAACLATWLIRYAHAGDFSRVVLLIPCAANAAAVRISAKQQQVAAGPAARQLW
jgi:hypothetical protein